MPAPRQLLPALLYLLHPCSRAGTASISPNGHRPRARLYDPDYNISLAAQILGWNLRTYGLSRGVAVYNQWSARLTPAGQSFPNQFYVDRVLRRYREINDF